MTQSGKKWVPVNANRAVIKGGEIFAKFAHNCWELAGSATISDPRNYSEDYYNNYLTFRPCYQTAESISYSRKIWSLTLSHRYLSRRYLLEANTDWLPPVSIFDLSLASTFRINGWKNELSLRLDNILNRQYSIINESPMPERNYSLKLTINFN
jgi:outer membrane cobalamin receptor